MHFIPGLKMILTFFPTGMGQLKKFIMTVTKPDTLKTLCHASISLIFLHFLIKFEQIRQNGAFHYIDIPIEPDFVPLGIQEPQLFPSAGESRIPHIIHQTWRSEEIPSKFSKWIQTWVKNHPGWTYYLWTDESARQLIKDRHPYLLKVLVDVVLFEIVQIINNCLKCLQSNTEKEKSTGVQNEEKNEV